MRKSINTKVWDIYKTDIYKSAIYVQKSNMLMKVQYIYKKVIYV